MCFWGYKRQILGSHCQMIYVKSRSREVAAMQDWPHPKTLKSLHGFSRLTSYYKKYVKNYGKIVAPSTTLLKKNAFVLSEVVEHAFLDLNEAICTSPTLAVLNFTKTFLLGCDASCKGINVMLMQEAHPLAFADK